MDRNELRRALEETPVKEIKEILNEIGINIGSSSSQQSSGRNVSDIGSVISVLSDIDNNGFSRNDYETIEELARKQRYALMDRGVRNNVRSSSTDRKFSEIENSFMRNMPQKDERISSFVDGIFDSMFGRNNNYNNNDDDDDNDNRN